MSQSRFTLILAIFLLGAVWFSNIGYRKLAHPDEGRYAEISREMVVSGDWVTPHLNNLKYLEKPPLQYWATGAAYQLFGVHEWSARLWASLTGFLGIILVWAAGSRLFSERAGIFAALALLASPYYVAAAHINTLDMGLTFFLNLALIGFVFAQRAGNEKSRQRWMLLTWGAMGLAVLSKGLIGLLLPLLTLIAYSLWQRDFSIWKKLGWQYGPALLLCIVCPWFIAVSRANPEFLQFFFIHEHLERFATTVHHRIGPWWYFIPILLLAVFPWLPSLYGGVQDIIQRKEKNLSFDARRFLLVWAATIFAFFSASHSKLPSYILPIIPALALIAGEKLAAMDATILLRRLIHIALLGAVGYFIACEIGEAIHEADADFQLYESYSDWIEGAALLLAIGAMAAWQLLRQGLVKFGLIIIFISHFIAVQLFLTGYEALSPLHSGFSIAQHIHSEATEKARVYSVGMYDQTLPLYLGGPVTLVQFKDELALGIAADPMKQIPTLKQFERDWLKPGEAFAIMPQDIYAELSRENLPMKVLSKDKKRILVKKSAE